MFLKRDDTGGFTLVEMAIILMILGILITMGAGMMGTLTKRLKLNETREAVKNASESIAGYTATTRHIPTSDNFTSVVTTASDAWANSLRYIPASVLTKDGICSRKTTGMAISLCSDKSCSAPRQRLADAAYVIISGGENFNIQTALTGTIVKVYDPGIGPVDDDNSDMSRAEPYDDVVKWATLYELRVKAGCSGPQLRIINKELPSAIFKDQYLAEVFAEGGVPFTSGGKYRWCVETQGQAEVLQQPLKAPKPAPVAKQPQQPKQQQPKQQKPKQQKPKQQKPKQQKPKQQKPKQTPKPPKKPKAWLKANPSKIAMTKNCMALRESKWGDSDTLILNGTAEVGTTGLTIYARDDNDRGGPDDNFASRAFVITVGK